MVVPPGIMPLHTVSASEAAIRTANRVAHAKGRSSTLVVICITSKKMLI